MSGKFLFVALLFACAGAGAECLPLEKTAEGTVFGDRRLSVTFAAAERMVRRQFAFAWDGTSPTGRLDGVWASGGKVLCSATKGRYFLPGCWPLIHYEVPFHDGWRQAVGGGRSGGPAPLVGEGGGRWGVLACLDETADHADRGETIVRTR